MRAANDDSETSDRDLRNFSGTLVLVGAGKMGAALLEGWLRLGLAANRVAVIEPSPSSDVAALAKRGLSLNPGLQTLRDPAVVVLAVKPQIAAEAMAPLRAIVSAGTLVISIMAGQTLRFLATALERAGALVRAMPNTPAAIGRGITVAVPVRA